MARESGVWLGRCVYRGVGMTLHVCLGEQMVMFDSDPSVSVFF